MGKDKKISKRLSESKNQKNQDGKNETIKTKDRSDSRGSKKTNNCSQRQVGSMQQAIPTISEGTTNPDTQHQEEQVQQVEEGGDNDDVTSLDNDVKMVEKFISTDNQGLFQTEMDALIQQQKRYEVYSKENKKKSKTKKDQENENLTLSMVEMTNPNSSQFQTQILHEVLRIQAHTEILRGDLKVVIKQLKPDHPLNPPR